MTGRGAWNKNGEGGTLNTKDKPGPYYLLPKDPNLRPGVIGFLKHYAKVPVDINEDAVYHGVIGIQALVKNAGVSCPINGVYDASTSLAVKTAQQKMGLTADGVIGPTTMKNLLLLVIKQKSLDAAQGWRPVYGVLANEGAFDPGAVGKVDENDLGLAQINILAHPTVQLADAFCPSFAVTFVTGLLAQGMKAFNDIDAAIASYNLGVGGARDWVKAGKPDVYRPWYSDTPRNVAAYINHIQSASNGVN